MYADDTYYATALTVELCHELPNTLRAMCTVPVHR